VATILHQGLFGAAPERRRAARRGDGANRRRA